MKRMYLLLCIASLLCICCLILYASYTSPKDEASTKEVVKLPNPSREPYDGCVWELVSGAGLALWGQSCSWDERKVHVAISETLPGALIEEIGNNPMTIGSAIQIFELQNHDIDDVIPFIRVSEGWSDTDACAFTKDEMNSNEGVTRYTLMPTGPALEKFIETGKIEPINSTCGGYGMGNSGVQYFEIHTTNLARALFLTIGQEAPLFDEKTILVQ